MSTVSAVSRGQPVRERVATSCVFVSFGLVLGAWAAHLPAVKHAIGASSSSMGSILLVLGVGAFIGMQVSGYVVDRFGSGRVAILGGAAMAFALVPPLVLSTWMTVAVAVFVLGLAIGVSEVGMNAAAVEVERGYRRPIMASFHGMFSVGSVLGALLGAVAFASGIGLEVAAVFMALLALAICASAAPTLLRRTMPSRPLRSTPRANGVDAPAAPRERWRLVVFGALAFLLLLTEGSAMDWSSLHAQQHLGTSASSGSLALASFVSAMTVGRFTVDRVASRVGPVKVLRWGSVVAAVGLIIITQAAALPLTCAGWIVLGIGLSGCVPQVFTATGNMSGASAKSLSRVVGAGYLAVLAGPALVGWLADIFTLNTAFILPTAGMLVCACAAGSLAVKPDSGRS